MTLNKCYFPWGDRNKYLFSSDRAWVTDQRNGLVSYGTYGSRSEALVLWVLTRMVMTQRCHQKALLSVHLLMPLSSIDSSARPWRLRPGRESLCCSYRGKILPVYPFKKCSIQKVPFNTSANLNYKHSICQAWFSLSQFIENVAGSTLYALPGSCGRKCSFLSLYI